MDWIVISQAATAWLTGLRGESPKITIDPTRETVEFSAFTREKSSTFAIYCAEIAVLGGTNAGKMIQNQTHKALGI